jgi:hypothetical protein
MAAEWGTPPWVINDDDDRLLWQYRWQAYNAEISRAQRDKSDAARKKK